VNAWWLLRAYHIDQLYTKPTNWFECTVVIAIAGYEWFDPTSHS
jgi:hypothetical protein